jgi:CDP-diacylglycerol--glycerol-3-phosphate 3-phosphatidyltransferase
MKHLPNALTIVRILVTPVVLALLFVDTAFARGWALFLFVAASISDWLDGKVARHYAMDTRLGQFLDPLADKVLVLGTFATLAVRWPELVPWWAVAVVAARDLAVTVLRSHAVARGRPLRTSGAAKTKTAFQLTFLILVLLLLFLELLPPVVASPAASLLYSAFISALLVATVAATVVTGAAYFSPSRHGA